MKSDETHRLLDSYDSDDDDSWEDGSERIKSGHRMQTRRGSNSLQSAAMLFDIESAIPRDDDDMRTIIPEYLDRQPSEILKTRTVWLVTLLFVQSLSSYIIESYSHLLQRTMLPTLFFTMLVGAGGNAGNQSAVFFIRSMHSGAINPRTQWKAYLRELGIGAAMSAILFVFGVLRVYLLQDRDITGALTIGTCLFVIVFISVIVGAALPLLLERIKVDPAHASTTIQVLMDVTGVWITCGICSWIL